MSDSTTLKEEFEKYFYIVYGGQEISKIQYVETRKAFIAGAGIMITIMTDLAEKLSMDAAALRLQKYHEEVNEFVNNSM